MKKYSGGKTKVSFTLGIYIWFWSYSLFCNLRDDYGNNVPSYLWMLVPVYDWVIWWRFLTTIKRTQQRIGMASSLSVGRAFFLSPFWFGAVPYINRHVNALYTFRAGGRSGQQLGMMTPASVPPPSVPSGADQPATREMPPATDA